MLLLGTGARLLQPWLIRSAIDDHLVPGSLVGFWPLCAGVAAAALGEWLCRHAQLRAIERAGQDALLDLRVTVFRHLQVLPMRFYDRTPTGRLVGRATTDVEALQELFSSGVVTILGDLVFLIAAVTIMLSLSVPLTLASLCVVPVFVAVTVFVRKRARRAYTEMRSRLSQMNSDLHEQVSGMSIVQLFAQEHRSAERFAQSNRGVRNAQLSSVRWESILSAATEMLGSFTTALILFVGGQYALEAVGAGPDAAAAGGMTLGTLYAFVDYMQRMFVPLNDLSMKYTVLQNALISSQRIFAVLDEPPEPSELKPAEQAESAMEAPPPASSSPPRPEASGAVEFRAVTFGYDPDNTVLQDFSLTVAPGERVAVVGSTGAGKTTLLNVLTRLYDIQAGSILLEGRDIRELPRTQLRRTVSVVAQDVFLFTGSILDNIQLGRPDATEAEAIAAANQLGLDQVVSRFAGGYHEPVAERGRNLSAGERQLIAFARMLVAEPRVLALDEATSNIDAHTEQLLQRAVTRLMAGRTSIVIAHRLATIRDADRILVMERGEIIESGTHAELIARQGKYYELDQRQ